jgi:hypothetical protein
MKVLIVLALVGLSVAQLHLPPMQVQIPIQRPQPPMVLPQQPIQPRNNWRPGQPDARCPIPDDHEGYAVLYSGPTVTSFVICWGGIGCKLLAWVMNLGTLIHAFLILFQGHLNAHRVQFSGQKWAFASIQHGSYQQSDQTGPTSAHSRNLESNKQTLRPPAFPQFLCSFCILFKNFKNFFFFFQISGTALVLSSSFAHAISTHVRTLSRQQMAIIVTKNNKLKFKLNLNAELDIMQPF